MKRAQCPSPYRRADEVIGQGSAIAPFGTYAFMSGLTSNANGRTKSSARTPQRSAEQQRAVYSEVLKRRFGNS